jgi:hypothetical protein
MLMAVDCIIFGFDGTHPEIIADKKRIRTAERKMEFNGRICNTGRKS